MRGWQLDLKGGAFNADGLEISPGIQGEGYGRAIMGDLIDASAIMGIEKIKLLADDIGIYVWLKMGFLPTAEAWREMRSDALDFIVLHRDTQSAMPSALSPMRCERL